jgi:hypothetical protein
MNPRKQVNLSRSFIYQVRATVLLLLMACSLLPTALRAQEADGSDFPNVTVLSQTETPDGVNTTLRINVHKDSFLSSSQPNTNFGNSRVLRLGWSSGDFEAMRILIEFDIAAIPRNAVINRADLFIFQTGVVPGGDRPMEYRAQFMRTAWDEGGVTWNNANYLGGDALPLGSVGSNPGWQTTEVTNLVRTWYSGARPNNGLIVIGDEVPANNRMRIFFSREEGGSAPYIVIDFTTGCDTLPPNASMNAMPTFSPSRFMGSWSGTDAAPSGCNPSGIASFDVDYRINGSSWHRWKNQTQSTSNTFKDWANNGDFVEFRARATDNAGNVQAFGNPQTSTRIDTEPPTVFVNPLPPTTISQFFTLSWSGTDNLSGVAHYDVQWRVNGGNWEMLLEESPQTFFQITGAQNGATYDFRIRATDNVGNSDEWPDNPQTSTSVITSASATVLPFHPNILKPTAPITTSFVVNWTSTAGAPIASYEIFYQFNGGNWQHWQTFPAGQTGAQFAFPALGLGDGAYGFEAVAINPFGQREPRNFAAEAIMLVDLADVIQPSAYMPVISDQINSVIAGSPETLLDDHRGRTDGE